MLNFGAVVLCWKYSTFRRSRDNLQLFQPWNSTLFLCSWRTRWVHFSLSGLKCAVGAHVLCRRWILNSPLSSLTPWATAKNDRGRSTVASQVFACRSTFVGVVLKSCLELMTEQLEKIAKDLPNGFLWGPNDQAEGLRRRFLNRLPSECSAGSSIAKRWNVFKPQILGCGLVELVNFTVYLWQQVLTIECNLLVRS